DWCGWCKRMDATTFSHPQISEYLGEKFYAVKFDAEREKDFITADTTFKFVPNGRRGYHEFAAFLLQGKMSYPTVVFLNEKLQMIQPVPGYMTAQQFDPILKYFGGDHYKKTPWDAFQKEYKSPIE
ncbi:MAG: thioredoxin fold domain-containing protein, partial [Bacteroidota bacterium]